MTYAMRLIVGCLLWSTVAELPRAGPHCLAGVRAEKFLTGVQHLLSATDSAALDWRAEVALPTMRRAEVQLLDDEAVCERAAREYAKHAGPAGELSLPFAVAVVAAPGLYVVELGATAGTDAEYWEVVLFSREWKRIGSYGGGS